MGRLWIAHRFLASRINYRTQGGHTKVTGHLTVPAWLGGLEAKASAYCIVPPLKPSGGLSGQKFSNYLVV
jgi:hypothetical protein